MGAKELLTSDLVLVVGHYGCGKTNLAINLALELVGAQGDGPRADKPVIVVDLDIVNPYFRASDSVELLENAGVQVVGPNFARTTLDTPSLPPAVQNSIDEAAAGRAITIIDVGGDPEGAAALARFSRSIAEKAPGYQMLYVVNQRRYQTTYAQEAAELLAETEANCHLRATHVVGNTHLQRDTTVATVVDALPFALGVSELTGLPLAFITAPNALANEVRRQIGSEAPVLAVERHVRTPWE